MLSLKNLFRKLGFLKVSVILFLGFGVVLAMQSCGQIGILALNQIETTKFRVEGENLFMNGEINSKTFEQFKTVYRENPQIKTLIQGEVPGSLDDETMIKLAYYVREIGLNTHLTASSEIYSGGVDLFLAGTERSMEDGAKIGVHSWSDGVRDAADYPRNAPEHEANRAYIEDMLGSDDFYWFTIYAAPAEGMHLMTQAEIEEYKLLTR